MNLQLKLPGRHPLAPILVVFGVTGCTLTAPGRDTLAVNLPSFNQPSERVYSEVGCAGSGRSGHQVEPAIASVNDTTWGLAYRDGNNFQIYSDVFDKSAPLPVGLSGDRVEFKPSGSPEVAADPSGRGLAAWGIYEKVPGSTERGLCVSSLELTSPPLGCSPVANFEYGPQSAPQIKIDDDVSMIVWEADPPPSSAPVLHLAWRDESAPAPGWTSSPMIPVNPAQPPLPGLAVDSFNNTWLVTWRQSSGHIGYAIHASGAFGDLANWHMGEITTANANLSKYGRPKAAGSKGHWVIAWEQGDDIHLMEATSDALINNTSIPGSPVTVLSQGSGQVNWDPDIETNGSVWGLVWTSQPEGNPVADGQEIAYVFGTHTPMHVGPVGTITSANPKSVRRFPSIAPDSAGRWIVAFTQDVETNSCHKIEVATTGPATVCGAATGSVPCPVSTMSLSCDMARANVWADFEACVTRKVAKLYGAPSPTVVEILGWFTSCRNLLVWPKQCSSPPARFVETDNGKTITDRLTNLVWERKSGNSAMNQPLTWSTTGPEIGKERGGGFAGYLHSLNASPGYAGSSGWRVPTIAELISTLDPVPADPHSSYADAGFECRDPGSFVAKAYWSATPALYPNNENCPSNAWNVIYGSDAYPGQVSIDGMENGRHIRAVRGGL